MAVSECFPSSFQINQRALLRNNDDGQNRPGRERQYRSVAWKDALLLLPSIPLPDFFSTGLHMCCTFISKANLLVVELSNTHLTPLAHLNTPFPFFCSHFLPPLPPPWKCHPFFDNQGKATPCHFSAKAHEWLLQRRHGISCHMGDLISERFEENQLCFPSQSSTWWLLCPFKIILN